jgi:hypothetical protein
MADNGIFEGISHLVDFGAGKGRVGFYLAEKKRAPLVPSIKK